LEDLEIPNKQIYIFVASQEELDEYKTTTANKYNIVVGFLGLAKQRNYITNYFKEKQLLVMLDDDITAINRLDCGKLFKFNSINFRKFILRAFRLCLENSAYLWGIHQTTHNPRFLRNSITFNLSFIVGHFFGVVNRHNKELDITMDIKEDYERTLKYWQLDKVLVKHNYICATTNTYDNGGGLQLQYPDRTDSSLDASKQLLEMYPEYLGVRLTELNSDKASRYPELKIIKQISSINFYKELQPLNKNDDFIKEILGMLEQSELKVNVKRLNTGIGISQAFGLVRRRKQKGFWDSPNNLEYTELYAKLQEFGEKYVKPYRGYTSIQVNKNYQSLPHVDKFNKGLSYIVGFGNYKDGELILNSYKFNIQYKPLLFDGSEWIHSTAPFTGTRYSLIYYSLIDS